MTSTSGFISTFFCCHPKKLEPELILDGEIIDGEVTDGTSLPSSPVLSSPVSRNGPILEFKLPGGGAKSIDFSNAEKLGLDLRRPTGKETAIKVNSVTTGGRAEEFGVKPGWT